MSPEPRDNMVRLWELEVMQQDWKGYRVRAELPRYSQIMVAKRCGKTEVLYLTFTFHRTDTIQFSYSTWAAEESGSMMLSGSRKVSCGESKWVHGSFSLLGKCLNQNCVLGSFI